MRVVSSIIAVESGIDVFAQIELAMSRPVCDNTLRTPKVQRLRTASTR